MVLSSTPAGKSIYNVIDKAMIYIGKGKELMLGKTGLDIDSYDTLIRPDTESTEKIANALDGTTNISLLSTEEKIVYNKMRTAYKYMLNEFVNKRSASPEQ